MCHLRSYVFEKKLFRLQWYKKLSILYATRHINDQIIHFILIKISIIEYSKFQLVTSLAYRCWSIFIKESCMSSRGRIVIVVELPYCNYSVHFRL